MKRTFNLPPDRRSFKRLSVALASIAGAGSIAFAIQPDASTPQKATRPTSVAIDALMPKHFEQEVQVMVELEGAPAAVLYAEALKAAQAQAPAQSVGTGKVMSAAERYEANKVQIDAAAASQVRDQTQTLDAVQRAMVPSLENVGAQVLFRVQKAFNGIAITVGADRIPEIEALQGVKSVKLIDQKYPTAFSSIDFVGTRAFWDKAYSQGVGIHGEEIKVAIIDTGIDYVHTAFGGPGTADAYAESEDKDPVPNAYYPSEKVAGGYDFAGDAYNGSNTPSPDANPMDTNGHGTACGSLAAGYGVNFGGTTYVGNYSAETPIGAMKITPGFAPQAKLYALRVFGTTGSTGLTTQAIEYAMDPNNDGDFSDRMDVISMSLGSNNGQSDDDSAVASTNAANAGILVITSAGNAGDTYFITGSPGSATGATATAASFNDQRGFIYDTVVTGNAPASVAGAKAFGIATTNSSKGTATGNVVKMEPNDSPSATTPVSNAAQIAGKIAYVDRVPGQAANAAARAKAAGAIALIFGADFSGNQGEPFLLNSGTSAPKIPEVVIALNAANNLKAAAQFDPSTGVSSTGLNVTITTENGSVARPSAGGDNVPSYTSRGPRFNDAALKPDLTAPAEVVSVAVKKTGTGVGLFNGTSSACPHVSGSMALMKQLHPTWSVEELRALSMNTATQDLFTSSPYASPSPAAQIGVSRVGAGRINLVKASQSTVVAYNKTNPGHINMGFGNVEVPADGSVSITKEMQVVNKGSTAVTYNLTYQEVNPVEGARFTSSVGSVTVPANGSTTFPVTFVATGSQLKHVKEASVATTQGVDNTNLPRHWLTEKAGYAVLTPTSGNQPQIRVALHAAPKPVSSMRSTTQQFTSNGANSQQFNLKLSGVPVNTGTNYPIDIISLVKPFELQYVHPQANEPNAAGDQYTIKTVGVTSDYAANAAAGTKASTILAFAVDTFGNMTTPSFLGSDIEIFIDTNLDGDYEFALYIDSRRISGTTTHSNVYTPRLVNLDKATSDPTRTTAVGIYTNGLPANARDTNPFFNSSVVIEVPASSLGYAGGTKTRFRYVAAIFGRYGNDTETPVLEYDIANPGVEVNGTRKEPFYFDDLPSTTIPVQFNGTNFKANKSLGVLLLHRHNATGNRSDIVSFPTPQITSFEPKTGPVGTEVTVFGSGFTPGTQVIFSPNAPAQTTVYSANRVNAIVPPGATTGPIVVSTASGSDSSEDLDDPNTVGTNEGVFTVTPVEGPSPTPSPSVSPQARTTLRSSR